MTIRLDPGSSAKAAGLGVGEWIGSRPIVGERVSATRARRLMVAAIVPMVAVTVWLALSSEHVERPLASALYRSYLTAAPMAIGLLWWVRRPASSIGPLLVAFGVLQWVVGWQFSEASLPFDVGVLAEAPAFLLTFYLFLAFPMGRLEPAAARWLMVVLAFVAVGFFLPWALFSPVIAGGEPLTRCVAECPENVLQIGTAPGVVEAAGKAETYSVLAIIVAVLVVYGLRVRAASRPRRRALMAVAVTSLLFLPAAFVWQFSRLVLELDPSTLDGLAWSVVGARVLLPLGFLIALLQAERFAGRARENLLDRLAGRPTPAQWREMVAAALDDVRLRLGYYEPATRQFREPDGGELTRPLTGSGRTWVPVDGGGRAVAAMVIDETLAEDPELVRAAASATLVAVQNGALEGELRASQERVLKAGAAERRRIERDLHDSAQQRLVALRIHLTLAGERLGGPEGRAMLEGFGAEVDEAIDELRAVAQGINPHLLTEGVGVALAAVAHRSALPTTVEDAWLRRHSQAVETTVYFCCLECLQNAAKHAGRGASVTIRLDEMDGRVSFTVEDDGAGFELGAIERGAGLGNLADRIAAVGGTLQVDAAPGRGTRVTGEIPAPN